MGKPYLRFFKKDWQADQAVRSCGPIARYVWLEMLLIMDESEPRGVLPFGAWELHHRIRVDYRSVKSALAELEHHKVFSRNEQRQIVNRRMLRELAKTPVNGSEALANPLANPLAKAPAKAPVPNSDKTPRKQGVNGHPRARASSHCSESQKEGLFEPQEVRAKKPRRGAHPIPDDWAYSQKNLWIGESVGLTKADVEREAVKFAAFKRSTTGKSALSNNWEESFSYWLTQEYTYGRARRQATNGQSILDSVDYVYDRLSQGRGAGDHVADAPDPLRRDAQRVPKTTA